MTESPNHWLKDVAGHAGLDLNLPRRPDISAVRKAWPEVARACKLADDRFTERVAGHFRIGVANLNTYDPQAVKLIPEAVARRYGILPLSSTETSVVVATSDPTNRSAHKDIVAHTLPLKTNAAMWDGKRWIGAADPRSEGTSISE